MGGDLLVGSEGSLSSVSAATPHPPAPSPTPSDEPIEIIKHLLVGSEGTLAFISQATYHTVPEAPHKASAFVLFPDVVTATRGASALRETGVAAAELFDRAALRQFEGSREFTALVPDTIGGALGGRVEGLGVEGTGLGLGLGLGLRVEGLRG